MAIDQNDFFYIALSHFPKFGPKSLRACLVGTNDYEKLFNGKIKDFVSLGIKEKTAAAFVQNRDKINLKKIKKTLSEEKINILTPFSNEYPDLLKEITTPPAIIFYRGNIKAFTRPSLSIVGTRRATEYGSRCTQNFINALSTQNLNIVSGLALGIDSIAHQSALDNKLSTIAVLGTGINNTNIYPRKNYQLGQKIIESGGLLISEFPLGTEGLIHHFPQRNRIISGLSKLTIVIEAAKKSGALITARLALEENRDVATLPGNIDNPYAAGPNELIRQGAIPITKTADILEILDLTGKINYSEERKIEIDSAEEASIFEHLSSEALHVDDLLYLTKLPLSVINSTLAEMEIKGMIKNTGGMMYIKL